MLTLEEAIRIYRDCNASEGECIDGSPLYAAAKAEDVGEFGQFWTTACQLLGSLNRLLEEKGA